MRQRPVIMFIFFIFLFNIVKTEQPKINLVKVKEFSSYDEYEKWRGVVKKPPRIIVDKGIIKFYDSKGRVIKEKRYRYMSEVDRKKIYEEYERSGKDIKSMEVYSEYAKVLPNEKGVLLIKTTTYYEGSRSSFEVIDENGNTLSNIEAEGDICLSPDGNYFVFLHRSGYDNTGIIDFYDRKGNILNRQQVFDYKGMSDIVFSDDSQYVCISHVGFKEHKTDFFKGGVVLFDNKGNIIWKKIEKNWNVKVIRRASDSEENILQGGFSPDNKVIILNSDRELVGFSISGELLWKREGVAHAASFSPDGNSISVVYLLTPDRRKFFTTIKILKSFTGEVIRVIEIPCKSNFVFDLQNNGKNMLLKIRDIESILTHSTATFLINTKGKIIRCNEVIKNNIEQMDVRLENGQLIISTEKGVVIYDIK